MVCLLRCGGLWVSAAGFGLRRRLARVFDCFGDRPDLGTAGAADCVSVTKSHGRDGKDAYHRYHSPNSRIIRLPSNHELPRLPIIARTRGRSWGAEVDLRVRRRTSPPAFGAY